MRRLRLRSDGCINCSARSRRRGERSATTRSSTVYEVLFGTRTVRHSRQPLHTQALAALQAALHLLLMRASRICKESPSSMDGIIPNHAPLSSLAPPLSGYKCLTRTRPRHVERNPVVLLRHLHVHAKGWRCALRRVHHQRRPNFKCGKLSVHAMVHWHV